MSKHGHQPQQQQSNDQELSHLPPEVNQALVENAKKADEEFEPVQQHLEKPRRYPRKKAH